VRERNTSVFVQHTHTHSHTLTHTHSHTHTHTGARPVQLNEREKLETEVLRQLLEYYFKIVRESITDSVGT
jgi:hypothetical protein